MFRQNNGTIDALEMIKMRTHKFSTVNIFYCIIMWSGRVVKFFCWRGKPFIARLRSSQTGRFCFSFFARSVLILKKMRMYKTRFFLFYMCNVFTHDIEFTWDPSMWTSAFRVVQTSLAIGERDVILDAQISRDVLLKKMTRMKWLVTSLKYVNVFTQQCVAICVHL